MKKGAHGHHSNPLPKDDMSFQPFATKAYVRHGRMFWGEESSALFPVDSRVSALDRTAPNARDVEDGAGGRARADFSLHRGWGT